jgi:AhpC/TSA family/Disulphide bond corrector protein DsbC
VELEYDLPKIKAQGFGLAGISYDSVAILKNFAQRRGITFPLLSDPESKIIRTFGILNESAPKNSPFFGIPYPGTYLVDARGVVLSKYFIDDFRERDTAGEILVRQFGIHTEEAQASADNKYFQISTSASNGVVHQGQHVSLIVDLNLKPKMHVYAPGVQGGYIPIEWTITGNPALKASSVQYPKPQVLRLEAIKETVPVYLGRFRLVREIVIGSDAQVQPLLTGGNKLEIKGALRYQVCDDRECYLPATLPLKWSLKFEPLDRQRVPPDLQHKPSEPRHP